MTDFWSQSDIEKVIRELEDFKIEIVRRFKNSKTKGYTFPRKTEIPS